jgi:hypothetical protein
VAQPDDHTVTVYSALRADCDRIGNALADKLHDRDRWIAATAIRLDCPLVSHDGLFENTQDYNFSPPRAEHQPDSSGNCITQRDRFAARSAPISVDLERAERCLNAPDERAGQLLGATRPSLHHCSAPGLRTAADVSPSCFVLFPRAMGNAVGGFGYRCRATPRVV